MTAIGRSVHGAAPEPEADDRALLERLRAGEDAAFGELFARHSMAVRRLAFGLVNDRSEAEDLTAEAFFRVLQAIRRGAGPVDNVRGYLLIVARRVAWEWSSRHRDVPVSDEELRNRAGADPDTAGQSTERNLITRAFTSLPERWRSVLWKVEVEGERPAVVATNFGLSANATAALARRARQGLRAAYLQAHLAAERSSTGCRDVLEKLGAYTAGSIRGSERRRIRAHLAACPSCTAMHAELRDVCSGLRAHAGLAAAPIAGLAAWQLAPAGGLAATVKGLLTSAKLQVAMAVSSVAAVGMVGFATGTWGSGDGAALDDLDGKSGVQMVITGSTPPQRSSSPSIALTTGELSTAVTGPRNRRPTGPAADPPTVAPAKAPAAGGQVVYRATSVNQHAQLFDDYAVVYETTSVTEVNDADQTTVYTETTTYTTPMPPQDDAKVDALSSSESPSTTITSTKESVTKTTVSSAPPTSATPARTSSSRRR